MIVSNNADDADIQREVTNLFVYLVLRPSLQMLQLLLRIRG